MQTALADFIRDTPEGREADAILRACVHCGFCTATCPTYQLLGDELDGPRGRIYLIKQVLEGGEVTAKTQLHLDRCLTCRSCETTCPSGVQYGRLVDIGRQRRRAARPRARRRARAALGDSREGCSRSRCSAARSRWAARCSRCFPRGLRAKIPDARAAGVVARRRGIRARCSRSMAASRTRSRRPSTPRWRACSTASASRCVACRGRRLLRRAATIT